METREELMITALTQRIAELERNLAEIRADATMHINRLNEENRRLNGLLGLQEEQGGSSTADDTN